MCPDGGKNMIKIVIKANALVILLTCSLLFFFFTDSHAGSLEPGSAPGPTMKTLDQIPPTWSQKLQCDTTACPRFELVLDGAGVLDKETGLVWEQSSGAATETWVDAMNGCIESYHAARAGWHLPTIEQLTSLVDFMVTTSPRLPSGHPFSNVQSGSYWSSTGIENYTTTGVSADAFTVNFGTGFCAAQEKTSKNYTWCVRGGQSHNEVRWP
jgi:hypothetical protein